MKKTMWIDNTSRSIVLSHMNVQQWVSEYGWSVYSILVNMLLLREIQEYND